MAAKKTANKVQQARALKSTSAKANTQAQLKQRRAEMFQLRLAGATYQDIADRYGLSVGTAHVDIQKVFDEMLPIEDLERQRQWELERLDRLRMGLWGAATRGNTQAVDSYLRLSARFARLAGLDAPVRVAGHDGGGLFPVVPRAVVVDVLTEVLGEVEGEVGVVDAEVITDGGQ
jgi:DNA-binding CsgD family transcriptional regulator